MYDTYGLLIGDRWHRAGAAGTVDVICPATEESVGTVPNAGPADWDAALRAAEAGFTAWRVTSAWERGRVLHTAAALIRARSVAIATAMSTETGKPLAEAQGEVNAAADQFEWHAEEARRAYGSIVAARDPAVSQAVYFEPVGIVLALSAWNFPVLLPARKLSAALAAGCAVICRPATEAPGACFAMAQALLDAGLPAGAITVLTGDPEPMVPTLIAAPQVRKVSFTGSVPVGKRILAECARWVKRASMELGGHAPVIVLDDADPVWSARTAAAAKFRNCGQVCISPSRFYVHESIRPAFVAAFAEFADGLRVGNGLDGDVQVGPLIRSGAVDRARDLVSDAVRSGARVVAGGDRPSEFNKGYFFRPTVLDAVPRTARIMQEEPFAPIAPVAGFIDEVEVLRQANALPFGLAAYIFSADGARAAQLATRLEAGMIGINEVLLASAEIPFGGVKESGFGREGGALGIREYLEPKYVRQRNAWRGREGHREK